jgi:ssDNA-binding Zn-finger/Zn-ribbon topoisomerase 1
MVTPPAEQWRYVKVNGTCPACGSTGTLFVGKGGYLTCGWLPCRDPLAASRLLEPGSAHLEGPRG